ncbi:OprD family porin [Pseudomonas benzenivorans]|uniref:OprD family porin n=1 Tax=Pseudomonas benzenivorans TaxID=556533 RepID=A0ABZ0PQL5_9PSED|nr:OprD family porin [Pseudomonas benzenivorans]WPC03434.1 OprD family porin [Pseudomonas benzenivorans]
MMQSIPAPRVLRAPLSLAVALALPASLMAAEGGFVAGSSATLTARNYYFSRDYSDIVGPNQQSKAEEWAQGFILNFKSGYTPGTVGFGIDAVGLLGLKLDSSPDRVNTGLLPVTDEGRAADEYSRLGAALKVKVSKTELRIGEQQLMLPVLYFGDIRLLPPTYQGASLVSNEFAGLTLQGGQLRSTSLRNEAGDGELGAMVGFVPRRQAGQLVTTDRFNYAGADYAFNDNRTAVGAWYAQLQDLYNQRHFSLKHSEPVGDWVLGASLGYFDSAEDGEQLIGKLDNQAAYSLLSAKYGGHTFYLGYQAMFGDDGLPRVFANVSPLGNEVPTFTFDSADERSWQVRYDYDFAALGAPGLVAGVRYIQGDNVDTGRGFEGKEWERDLDIGYVVQSGSLKGLGVKVRNVTARSNYRTDVDENRLIFNYTWSLL